MRTAILGLVAATLISFGQTNLYTLDKEAALGAALADQVRGQVMPVSSPAALEYLSRIGRQLGAQLTRAPFPYSFGIIAGPGTNSTQESLALPGGYILVPSELILAARDEGELAGMLAHSMAHVSLRHYTRGATQALVQGVTATPFVFMGKWTGAEIRPDDANRVYSDLLKFQRDAEIEADGQAAKLMAAAGFDPLELQQYVDRTQMPPSKGQISALPPKDRRLSKIQSAIKALPRREYMPSGSEQFLELQAEIRRELGR